VQGYLQPIAIVKEENHFQEKHVVIEHHAENSPSWGIGE